VVGRFRPRSGTRSRSRRAEWKRASDETANRNSRGFVLADFLLLEFYPIDRAWTFDFPGAPVEPSENIPMTLPLLLSFPPMIASASRARTDYCYLLFIVPNDS